MAKIEENTDYTVEFVRQQYINLLNLALEKSDLTNVKGALELMSKHKAMLTDNYAQTQTQQAQELTEEEIIELKRLAALATSPKLVKNTA